MRPFPASADEFYALRDDRTNRCVGSGEYQKARCALVISEDAVASFAGQVMLRVAANLLSRWCRRVTVVLPSTDTESAVGLGVGNLGEVVLAQMRDADPFGNFNLSDQLPMDAPLKLCIGHGPSEVSDPASVCINASGWLASISIGRAIPLEPSEVRNPLGAIAAACLGIAQLFKIAVQMPRASYLRAGIFDVFSLAWLSTVPQGRRWPESLDIGRILMVGAGSVGSSAVYSMHLAGLAGSLTIVDNDDTKIENFNRSPIFGQKTLGEPKSAATAAFLSSSTLSPTPVVLWWDEFLKQHGRAAVDFDVWLPLANDFDVRRSMQHNVPPLLIHASTTANWGVNHARHIPGRDDCLVDRFPTVVTADQLACGVGKISAAEVTVDAALPFISFFAGMLVAADLVRAQLPDYPQTPNFALIDWYGNLEGIQSWDRKPRPGCVCGDQAALHEYYNRNTRHYPRFKLA